MRLQNVNDMKKNKEVVLGDSHLRAGMKESGESYLKKALPGERTTVPRKYYFLKISSVCFQSIVLYN